MKKLLIAMMGILVLTGCGKTDLKKEYEEMTIGNNVESYQLDLRISGMFKNERVFEIIKVDNFKNKEFRILNDENTYYVVDGKKYKEVRDEERITYETVELDLFTNTDIILQGLKNIKSQEKIDTDINMENVKTYKVELEEAYLKDLMTKLGYSSDFKTANCKVYLKEDTLYKIVYEIDDLTISGSFFRINNIRELKIDFENTLYNDEI